MSKTFFKRERATLLEAIQAPTKPFQAGSRKDKSPKNIGSKKEKKKDKSESTSPVCQKTNIWGSVQVVT